MILTPEDLSGHYDYIPDIESMKIPDETRMIEQKRQLLEIAATPVIQQLLAGEKQRVKIKELLEDLFEQMGTKDADKYFERLEESEFAGAGGLQAGPADVGPGGQPGMAGGFETMAGGEGAGGIPGPPGVQG
jgi:hypothetical protein